MTLSLGETFNGCNMFLSFNLYLIQNLYLLLYLKHSIHTLLKSLLSDLTNINIIFHPQKALPT